MNNNFARNLKIIRNENQIKQCQLANKLNVKQSTISSWESGRTEPSMGDIARIADALGCTQTELIGIEKKTGEISFEDILVRINSLKQDELLKIKYTVDRQIEINAEIEILENEKAEQTKRLLAYEKRLSELKGDN